MKIPACFINGTDSPSQNRAIQKVDDTDYIIFASFVEIYNEKIFDLLVDPSVKKRSELRIRQDAKGPFVGGATTVQIDNPQDRISFVVNIYKLTSLDMSQVNTV